MAFAQQMDRLQRWAHVVPADYRDASRLSGAMAAITFDDAFVSVIDHALPELASRKLHCAIFVPSGVLARQPDWAIEGKHDRCAVVDAERLKKLPGALVTIGAHSVTHPFLTRIPLERARWEIATSRASLAELIGMDVKLFAFPYGDYNDAIVEICRQQGYEQVFTTNPQPVALKQDAFLRGRVLVNPSDGSLEFFLKSSGAYAWMSFASRFKRTLKMLLSRGNNCNRDRRE